MICCSGESFAESLCIVVKIRCNGCRCLLVVFMTRNISASLSTECLHLIWNMSSGKGRCYKLVLHDT